MPDADGVGPGRSAPTGSPSRVRGRTPAARGRRRAATTRTGTWVLNGGKRFITNAGMAGTYIVTAMTGETAEGERRSARSSSRPTRRASRSAAWRRRWASTPSATGELLFDGCACRPPTCSARRARASRRSSRSLDGGRISIAAHGPRAVPGGATRRPSPYAKEREQFGRPIGTFQGVAFMIADMATEIEAARAARLPVGVAEGPGPRLHPGGGAGEALRVRGLLARDERRDPGPRRLRLHRGVQGRALSCATRS